MNLTQSRNLRRLQQARLLDAKLAAQSVTLDERFDDEPTPLGFAALSEAYALQHWLRHNKPATF